MILTGEQLPNSSEYQMTTLSGIFLGSLHPELILHKFCQLTEHTCGRHGGLKEVHIATEVVSGREEFILM